MANIITGKEYSAAEILNIYGPEGLSKIYEENTFIPPQKQVVYTYNQLDSSVKAVYDQIYQAVKNINANENFSVFVTGDHVTGKWVSEQEAATFSQQLNKTINPTPFDYWTTAKNYPTRMELSNISPVVPIRLNPANGSHMVIIPPVS